MRVNLPGHPRYLKKESEKGIRGTYFGTKERMVSLQFSGRVPDIMKSKTNLYIESLVRDQGGVCFFYLILNIIF